MDVFLCSVIYLFVCFLSLFCPLCVTPTLLLFTLLRRGKQMWKARRSLSASQSPASETCRMMLYIKITYLFLVTLTALRSFSLNRCFLYYMFVCLFVFNKRPHGTTRPASVVRSAAGGNSLKVCKTRREMALTDLFWCLVSFYRTLIWFFSRRGRLKTCELSRKPSCWFF